MSPAAAHLNAYGLEITTLDVSTILLLKIFPSPRAELALRVSMAEIDQHARSKYVVKIDVAVAPSRFVDDTDCL